MKLTLLGTRREPTLTRLLRVSAPQQPRPVQPVERQQRPYWQEHGWTKEGNRYEGRYETPFGVFEGWIEERRSRIDFYVHSPCYEVLHSSHGACFQRRDDDWYLVHMSHQPRDVSTGIMAVERVICEAYRSYE